MKNRTLGACRSLLALERQPASDRELRIWAARVDSALDRLAGAVVLDGYGALMPSNEDASVDVMFR